MAGPIMRECDVIGPADRFTVIRWMARVLRTYPERIRVRSRMNDRRAVAMVRA
jgi:hypothetical protein